MPDIRPPDRADLADHDLQRAARYPNRYAREGEGAYQLYERLHDVHPDSAGASD